MLPSQGIASALGGLRVLVVDDSPINLKLATALLEGKGVEVMAVESAADALAAVADHAFDLILMDLEMPLMSGLEAAGKMRDSRGGALTVPIVAVTAHAFPEKHQEVIEAGMNDLLAKPYLPEQLYAMVAKWSVDAESHVADRQAAAEGAGGVPIYNRDAALAIVGGDAQAAHSMLDEFLNLVPETEQAIRMAQAAADYTGLFHAAHKLAGSAPIVGATALHRAAVHLQNFLNLDPKPVERIDRSVDVLLEQIAHFRAEIDS